MAHFDCRALLRTGHKFNILDSALCDVSAVLSSSLVIVHRVEHGGREELLNPTISVLPELTHSRRLTHEYGNLVRAFEEYCRIRRNNMQWTKLRTKE